MQPPLTDSLDGLIAWAESVDVDPYPIIADELRKLGYTVIPPDVGGMGKVYDK